MIEIHFNPKSSYMKTRKSGVEGLIKNFSRMFCEATGGRTVETYKVKNILVIKTEVYADTFALFDSDYERFMVTIFGGVSLKKFGVSKLAVFNHAQKKLQMKQQFIENA
jgi:hypothetical protein